MKGGLVGALRDMVEGTRVSMVEGRLSVPDDPIVHYIEGDGIGVDITPVMIEVVDAAIERAYGSVRRIHWNEVLAGQKAFDATGEWMPAETLEAMRTGLVSIKGPLTTPVGGGIRSLNVALGATNHVSAYNEVGDGLGLNRRRGDVTNLVEGIQQGLTELERSEIHWGQLTCVR